MHSEIHSHAIHDTQSNALGGEDSACTQVHLLYTYRGSLYVVSTIVFILLVQCACLYYVYDRLATKVLISYGMSVDDTVA
jgi:hypothetical protein